MAAESFAGQTSLVLDPDLAAILTDFDDMLDQQYKYKEQVRKLENDIMALKKNLQDTRNAEVSASESLESSRKLIAEQQVAIGKLLATKDEIKKFKDEIADNMKTIDNIEREKSDLVKNFQNERQQLFQEYQQRINYHETEKDIEIKALKNEIEKIRTDHVSNIDHMNNRIVYLQNEKEKQINEINLNHEEELQRAHAQILQMRDDIKKLNERNNSITILYKKKITALENLTKSKSSENISATVEGLRSPTSVEIMNQKASKSKKVTFDSTKSTIHNYDPLPIEIIKESPTKEINALPKVVVKPNRRKLFNKFQDYLE